MLSRTADSLYWLARYVERAENTARTVLVGHWMASMARSLGNPGNEWESTLIASGCEQGYRAKYAEVTPASVVDYLVRDPENPSSLYSCIETARRNARAVRTALTVDMWNALNETWLRMREKLVSGFTPDQASEVLEWVKQRSQLFNGAYANTMLRNDAYYFTRLGTFLERADNTARLLDVKYHYLLPRLEDIGGPADLRQWAAVLRSASAFEAFRKVYGNAIRVNRVVEILVFDPTFPRSMRFSIERVALALARISLREEEPVPENSACAELLAMLRAGSADQTIAAGLHEFLIDVETRCAHLADHVFDRYMSLE